MRHTPSMDARMRTLLLRPARLLAAAALAAAVAGAPARADTPCTSDAEKLCPGIPAQDGRLWACLVQHEFQLSSACVENLQELRRRANELSADCSADVFRFCRTVPRGQGRVLECLRSYVGRRELSSNCEETVVTALEKLNEFAVGCGDDSVRLCPGVEVGGGRMFLCLRAQYDKLSTRCKRAVSP